VQQHKESNALWKPKDFSFKAFVYLLAAVATVPIAKQLGLGSVLGYLLAGVVIGPHLLGLVGQEFETAD
jgi:Kef-type K+ transport system membrane component KefB